MKNVVIYSSKTGNTKKVAEAIYDSISNAEILSVNEIRHLNYETIIIGGWIDKGTFDEKALNILKKLKNKNIAYFFTLGASIESDHAKYCAKNIEEVIINNGNTLIGNFVSQGKIDPKLTLALLNLPKEHKMYPSKERMERWEAAKDHPNELDLERAKNTFSKLFTNEG